MAGAGAGGLIGAELTDFVFILNSPQAVESFSKAGTLTLGGNISVAAGPLGRNAEADAAASMGGVAAVFTYSKTKGLFAGVSVEGSAIVERKDANRKFYGASASAKQILTGRVRPPPAADPLFRVLESRAFNFRNPDEFYADSFYDDIPESFDSSETNSVAPVTRSSGRRGYGRYNDDFEDSDDDYYGDGYGRGGRYGRGPPPDRFDRRGGPPDRFDRYGGSRRGRDEGFDSYDDPSGANEYYRSQRKGRSRGGSSRLDDDPYEAERFDRGSDRFDRYGRHDRDVDDLSNRFSRSKISPSGPPSNGRATRGEKDEFGAVAPAPVDTSPRSSSNTPKAVALYTFSGEEYGDLPFRKGDVITILKKSDSQDDWWTGRVNGREGIFPANYVELV